MFNLFYFILSFYTHCLLRETIFNGSAIRAYANNVKISYQIVNKSTNRKKQKKPWNLIKTN